MRCSRDARVSGLRLTLFGWFAIILSLLPIINLKCQPVRLISTRQKDTF